MIAQSRTRPCCPSFSSGLFVNSSWGISQGQHGILACYHDYWHCIQRPCDNFCDHWNQYIHNTSRNTNTNMAYRPISRMNEDAWEKTRENRRRRAPCHATVRFGCWSLVQRCVFRHVSRQHLTDRPTDRYHNPDRRLGPLRFAASVRRSGWYPDNTSVSCIKKHYTIVTYN